MRCAEAFGMGGAVVWLHMSREDAAALAGRLADCAVTLLNVADIDWNHDLTPWPGAAVFRGQPDFGGGGEAYLRELTEKIIPETEARLGLKPIRRCIAGYSLAGMFALWAAVCSDCFDAAASVSGSLWYDGFANFVCEAGQLPECVYLSVGDRECRVRNSAFRRIEDCTQRIEAHLRRKGVDVIFEHNPGGHFDDPLGRMERAIRWLLREGSRR